MTKYPRIIQFRVTDLQWLGIHKLPPGRLPVILRQFLDSYLDKPEKLPEIKKLEINISKTRTTMQEIGKKLANMEATKLAIEEKEEQAKEQAKKDDDEETRKQKRVIDSIKASGVHLEW